MNYEIPPKEIIERFELLDWIAGSSKLLDALQWPEFDLGRCKLVAMTPAGAFYRSKTGYLFFQRRS